MIALTAPTAEAEEVELSYQKDTGFMLSQEWRILTTTAITYDAAYNRVPYFEIVEFWAITKKGNIP